MFDNLFNIVKKRLSSGENVLDVTLIANALGFEDPIYISTLLWNKHVKHLDGNEHYRLLLIFQEYFIAFNKSGNSVLNFDVSYNSEFFMKEELFLRAVSNIDGIIIQTRFDDIFRLIDMRGN